ncbi:MAG TPA: phosphoribosylformylglycinamidine synthase subunit PurL [Solirubrobacteraceae bacterium]|nr:phosphoribosylformylglycinamidine synthase subunit PurL [Solirubrobacteraceae bacterium]
MSAGGAPALSPEEGLARALALGLSEQEYELLCERHGRPPNLLELAMYSLMWSEHCGYKHSKLLLRTLPSAGPAVVVGPGENAGALDIGGGLVCSLKVESHNHPSAVEPFQGAATGVGGILRDIVALGTRPAAVLDSLRFGLPTSARSRYLLDGAVRGIAHYGNCVGVATVGGELYFEAPYERNCLVNVMAIGLARREELLSSAARGPGNTLLLFGARTGRDGIGGASVLASTTLADEEHAQRPTVQVGDPFAGNKLIDCALALRDAQLLIALQDLGAAGLTSACSEMAAKGGVGLDIDVARVPLREAGMEPFEIMVSESQERMVAVVAPERVGQALAICERYEVEAAAIGSVTDSGCLRIFDSELLLGTLPVRALVDECPLYELRPQPPARPAPAASLATGTEQRCGADPPAQLRSALLALLASPNIASRAPLFEQYDCLVGGRTIRRPAEADAALLALPDGGALALSIDGNGRRVAADPYRGTLEVLLECAANLACVGAEPIGATDNLNFGDPERGEVAWQLCESVRALGDGCRALGVPIVSGNVSLYNESAQGPIHPTPVVGMLGRLERPCAGARIGFAGAGAALALLGPFAPSLRSSELARLRGEEQEGLPELDLAAVVAAQRALRAALAQGRLQSAHDISDGGLAVALAECVLASGLGARIDLRRVLEHLARIGAAECKEGARGLSAAETALFGEGPGGFLVSGEEASLTELAAGAPLMIIGGVGGEALVIEGIGGPGEEGALALEISALRAAYASLAELFT